MGDRHDPWSSSPIITEINHPFEFVVYEFAIGHPTASEIVDLIIDESNIEPVSHNTFSRLNQGGILIIDEFERPLIYVEVRVRDEFGAPEADVGTQAVADGPVHPLVARGKAAFRIL